CGDPATSSPSMTWLVTPAPVVPELGVRLCAGSALISWRGLPSGGLMIRPRNLVILAGAAAATVAVMRHGRRATRGHTVAGGILIGHAGVYDALSRLLPGPLIDGIAAGVAAVAPAGAQVLEVGCGPGHLSIRL